MKLLILTFLLCFGIQAVLGANSTCNCTKDFQVTTLNSYQISIAPFREQRLNATIEYFKSGISDVICLQEFWDPEKRDQMINGLKSVYPHSFYAPRVNGSENCTIGCGLSELNPFINCVTDNSNCSDVPISEFLSCALKNCSSQLATLTTSCLGCLSYSNETTMDERFQTCLDPLISDSDENSTSCKYFFGGWSDNLILSKYPFIEKNYTFYKSSPLVAWSALYARVNATDIGDVNIFCTHLSADIPLIDTEEANKNQSKELVQFVDSQTAGRSDPVFIMGDFNSGPSRTNVTAAWLVNYQILSLQPGWTNLYLTYNNKSQCTFCESNPLTIGKTNTIIDHIFGSHIANVCISEVDRIATENVVILDLDNNNSTNSTAVPLSDHYGLTAHICGKSGNGTVPTTVPPTTTLAPNGTATIFPNNTNPIVSSASSVLITMLHFVGLAFLLLY